MFGGYGGCESGDRSCGWCSSIGWCSGVAVVEVACGVRMGVGVEMLVWLVVEELGGVIVAGSPMGFLESSGKTSHIISFVFI